MEWLNSYRGPITVFYTGENAGIRCDLPRATSGAWSGRSWIVGYYITN
jgi:hypothetical protein